MSPDGLGHSLGEVSRGELPDRLTHRPVRAGEHPDSGGLQHPDRVRSDVTGDHGVHEVTETVVRQVLLTPDSMSGLPDGQAAGRIHSFQSHASGPPDSFKGGTSWRRTSAVTP